MAVTQYVGARYVPLFAEPLEWDKNTAYEPLTIVYNNGNSYTSRQHVPTGIEIDNETYWALTGNYNAQIEQYREEVKQYDARIAANASAIEQTDASVTQINERVTSNESAIGTNTTAISNEVKRATAAEETKAPINHATNATTYGAGDASNYGHVKLTDSPSSDGAASGIAATPKLVADSTEGLDKLHTLQKSRFKGKTVITIGDSIMLGTGTTGTGNALYSQIGNLLGATVYNYAENNAGFTTLGSGSRKANYAMQLNAAYVDHPDADVIIVSGGSNDATVNSDIYTAAKSALQYAVTSFKNAVVYVAPLQYGACQGTNSIVNGNNGRNVNVIQDISKAALETGCMLINHCWEMMIGQTDLLSDDIHPNNSGALLQAQKIVMGMYGYDYRPSYSDGASSDSTTLDELRVNCVDGIVTFNGVIKTTKQVNGFTTLFDLPKYASRALNTGIAAYIGESWTYVALFQNGTRIMTTSTINSGTTIYITPQSWPIGC